MNIREPKKSGFSDTAFTKNREEPNHSWVPGVAGFSASFVGEILDRDIDGRTKFSVLDPFAGVGTTLAEEIKHGCNVVGFEVRGLHMVRKKRTGSSIINSGVRAGNTKKKTDLYEVAIELRAPK